MRRAQVRLYGVGVKMLRGDVFLVLEQNRLGPIYKILRGAGHDGAFAVDEGAVVLAVLFCVGVPKGEDLRIKRDLGDDRFVLHHFPMNFGIQTILAAAAFITLTLLTLMAMAN